MDFEKSFSDYLERREYDDAENALFSIIRSAYQAGWSDAGGEITIPSARIIHIVKNKKGEKDD
ncbi:MAG: hypothetical protein IJH32_00320 [Ruminococcus sp.]|nr:hypothetical protein [Ruminococcus sp.]